MKKKVFKNYFYIKNYNVYFPKYLYKELLNEINEIYKCL